MKQILKNTNRDVIGTSRNTNNSNVIDQLRNQFEDRFKAVDLNLIDLESRNSAIKEIKAQTQKIDLVFLCSGVVRDSTTNQFPTIPEKNYNDLDEKWLSISYQTNVIGPIMFLKELIPTLLQGHSRQNPAVVVSMSAKAGSITENNFGGWHALRTSKCALNMMIKNYSVEFKTKGILFISLCPGHVKTSLMEPFPFRDKVEPEGRVSDLLNVIDNLTEQQTGGFYDWKGNNLPF